MSSTTTSTFGPIYTFPCTLTTEQLVLGNQRQYVRPLEEGQAVVLVDHPQGGEE